MKFVYVWMHITKHGTSVCRGSWYAYLPLTFMPTKISQSSIRSQHEPMVHDVVHRVRNSYAEKTIQIPYDELPVVCIQSMRLALTNMPILTLKNALLGSLSGSSILDDVCSILDQNEDVSVPWILQVHLYASDCPNVMTGMKNIIASLTERADVLEIGKKPNTQGLFKILIIRMQLSASQLLQ